MDALSQGLQKHSRLVAEQNAHEFNVQQRDAFVKQYAARLGAPADASGEDVSQRLRTAVSEAQQKVDRLRSEHQAADDQATARVDAAQSAVSSAREAARLARAQAVRNDQVMLQLQQEVCAISCLLPADVQVDACHVDAHIICCLLYCRRVTCPMSPMSHVYHHHLQVDGLAVNQALLAAEEANVATLQEEQRAKQAAAEAADGPQLTDVDAQLQGLRDTITALRQVQLLQYLSDCFSGCNRVAQ